MTIRSWGRLIRQWVCGQAFLFVVNYLLLGLVDPPFSVARAAFIAVFGSTFIMLPEALSKLTPIGTVPAGRPGFTSTDQSRLCYAVLLSGLMGAALAAAAPAWEWRALGLGGAGLGCILAYGVWRGAFGLSRRL